MWQYYRDEASLTAAVGIRDFIVGNHNSKPFKFKQNIRGQTDSNGRKNVQIMVSLKYQNNFWKTLKMPLFNCEIRIQLTWFQKCVIASDIAANQETKFAINDTKMYVLVVTLSAQDNARLLKQLQSGFKSTTNWNKYK